MVSPSPSTACPARFSVSSSREDFGALSDQANVQVPWELDVGSGEVEVRVHWETEAGTVSSDPFMVSAVPSGSKLAWLLGAGA